MADNARGIHVSPGIYAKETELTYAVKSLGITTLGLVGETLKGPAFQPMMIENWRDFQSMFGGTSAVKFPESQYPKYELPYVAKSYLSESNQLQVCRVLGLSGYNAGPAWVVTAEDGKDADYYKFKTNLTSSKKAIMTLAEASGITITATPEYGYRGGDLEAMGTDAKSRPGYKGVGAKMVLMVGNERAEVSGKTEGGNVTFKLDSLSAQTEPTGDDKELDVVVSIYLTDGKGNELPEEVKLSSAKYEFKIHATKTSTDDFEPKIEIVGEKKSKRKIAVAVLRSRGHYEKCHLYEYDKKNECECPSNVYDRLFYEVGEITEGKRNCSDATKYNMGALDIEQYQLASENANCLDGSKQNPSSRVGFDINSVNHGRFKIIGIVGAHDDKTLAKTKKDEKEYFEFPVSLNPNDNDYILKVLGTDPLNGDSPVYVETLYDVALHQEVEEGTVCKISDTLTQYNVDYKSEYCYLTPVNGFVRKQESGLTRKDVGLRVIADKTSVDMGVMAHKIVDGLIEETNTKVVLGQIYVVKPYIDASGHRKYFYTYENLEGPFSEFEEAMRADKLLAPTLDVYSETSRWNALVKNASDGKYYKINNEGDEIIPLTCDMNDYKDAYRFASTPWFVSNIKGDATKMELNKLFRFHTISDGDSSNNEIKVTIQNVSVDKGTFDVVVRAINDTDAMPVVLEKYLGCTMTPNTTNYIAYRIGSFNGKYESKSKYITVEVNDTIAAINSVPAGFLGYPLSKFNGVKVNGVNENVLPPHVKYNLFFNEDVKHRKQCFGLSDITGVDIDMFTYKGRAAYSLDPEFLSMGFHLDSRLNDDLYGKGSDKPTITVDGVSGYQFKAVSSQNRTTVLPKAPIVGTDGEMYGSIYEYSDLRKFTAFFYGGFDGWDEYRGQRTNTDEFKMSKYKGDYNDNSGEGLMFDKIDRPEDLQLNQKAITSDWYAYLAAYRQFSNPEFVDINVFATPGIDLINNKTLAQEVIEMIEEERADSIYVATMPDKPSGAADYVDEMYSPDDAVYELEGTEIDSNYTCTYYPWVKYEDVDNNQYIYLPPTKDVVRNMAMTDNTTHPWFAPAGISRGDVKCVRAHYVTKLTDEDVLYEGRINPIKTFASDGVKVWGQKNLQVRESQLNRIAVRRLLLRMRKLIAISCIGLIFEPNDATTKNKFLSIVTPILDNIRANRGISDYKIEVNDSIESRERRELPAKIFFKPYNALEYIDLDFILTPEGVSFDNI